MSLLTVVQSVCKRLGLPSPSTVIGNTDKLVGQLLALLEEGGDEVRRSYFWPQLNREATITLVTAQAGYDLPTDIDYSIARTHWDRSNEWPLIGPLSPEEWQVYQSGISVTPTRKLFRVKGFGPAKLHIFPTPTAGDNGNTLVYEYQSKFWIRAAASTEGSKQAFTVDTDVSLLDEELLKKELYWRWRRAQRLDHALEQEEAEAAWKRETTALKGQMTINRASRGRGCSSYPGYPNVPESGFGS